MVQVSVEWGVVIWCIVGMGVQSFSYGGMRGELKACLEWGMKINSVLFAQHHQTSSLSFFKHKWS